MLESQYKLWVDEKSRYYFAKYFPEGDYSIWGSGYITPNLAGHISLEQTVELLATGNSDRPFVREAFGDAGRLKIRAFVGKRIKDKLLGSGSGGS